MYFFQTYLLPLKFFLPQYGLTEGMNCVDSFVLSWKWNRFSIALPPQLMMRLMVGCWNCNLLHLVTVSCIWAGHQMGQWRHASVSVCAGIRCIRYPHRITHCGQEGHTRVGSSHSLPPPSSHYYSVTWSFLSGTFFILTRVWDSYLELGLTSVARGTMRMTTNGLCLPSEPLLLYPAGLSAPPTMMVPPQVYSPITPMVSISCCVPFQFVLNLLSNFGTSEIQTLTWREKHARCPTLATVLLSCVCHYGLIERQ